ncbi:hypothetical protein J7E62_15475 [Variovorax paradoxus]|nr:hypothetical protein [Variovorax paradoxus]
MPVICPQCKTKNRSAAKFCIECIGTLPTAFADGNFASTVRSGEATRPAAVPFSKGLWVSIAGLSIALIIGAAGWLVAGAGGWYLYTAGKTQVHPVRPEAAVEPAAAAVPASAPVASPAAPAQAEPVAMPLTEKATPSAAPASKPKSTFAARTGTSSAPDAACTNMNLISQARCMAAQCLKPEFKAHPQCETVRRQQQLEEQKRNPMAP